MTTIGELTPAARWSGILVVWAGAVVGAVLIGLFSAGQERWAWMALTLAACTVGTMCIQTATRQKAGYVGRMATSVVGALIVLALATAVFAVLPAQ